MSASEEIGSTGILGEDSPFPFSYSDFIAWYDRLKHSRLQPALATFGRLLGETLDSALDEFDRKRIRLGDGRIKNPNRVWTKLLDERYRVHIQALDDIPAAIDDLIGVRLVCNNLCDVAMLQGILGRLPESEDVDNAPLAIEVESERPYFREPKPSGYRAYHINLVTAVPSTDGFHKVRGELQVRTLLQEGWGELTHEDTYKPGAELPKLAATIARRMADLLATVDDMAEDLRQELDRSLRAAMDSEPGDVDVVPDAGDLTFATQDGLGAQEAPFSPSYIEAELRDIVKRLTRAASLASVAQELQARLGPEVAAGWGSHATFKRLLRAAVPDVEIIEVGPQYIVPDGAELPVNLAVAGKAEVDDDDCPRALLRLNEYDGRVPIVSKVQLQYLMEGLTQALARDTWTELGIGELTSDSLGLREVNAITRHVRDVMKDMHPIKRHHLDYLLKGLLWSGNLRPGLPLGVAIDILVDWFSSRAAMLGLGPLQTEEQDEIKRWLQGES